MKVIINGRFLCQRITGVQRFAIEIIKELDKLVSNDNYEIYVPKKYNSNIALKNISIIKSCSSLNGPLWDIFSFSSYVRKQHSLSINLCNGITIHKNYITCLHDVTCKVNPYFHSETIKDKLRMYWNCLSYLLNTRYAKHIITVSNFSKNEIIKFYHVKEEKISVIYNAWQHVNDIEDNGTDLEKKYSFLSKGNYFFSLSTLAANKNFKWVLHAAKNNPEHIFAIAGGGNLRGAADSIGLSNLPNVHFLGYVTDEEAKSLMKNCKAFIFPSLYEGFGLPPLEAMGAGCKNIIVSDIEVMHEIFGDSANYITPTKLDYKFQAQDFAERTNSCQETLDKYSWKKSALSLYNIIKNLKS